jgi:hypothetical protein
MNILGRAKIIDDGEEEWVASIPKTAMKSGLRRAGKTENAKSPAVKVGPSAPLSHGHFTLLISRDLLFMLYSSLLSLDFVIYHKV